MYTTHLFIVKSKSNLDARELVENELDNMEYGKNWSHYRVDGVLDIKKDKYTELGSTNDKCNSVEKVNNLVNFHFNRAQGRAQEVSLEMCSAGNMWADVEASANWLRRTKQLFDSHKNFDLINNCIPVTDGDYTKFGVSKLEVTNGNKPFVVVCSFHH